MVHSFVQSSVRCSSVDVISAFREGHVSTNKLIGRAMLEHRDGVFILFLFCYSDFLRRYSVWLVIMIKLIFYGKRK